MSVAHQQFEPSPANASRARRFAAEELAAWGVPQECVILVVSELVTNAILHARSEFEVGLFHLGEHVRIEVCDDNPRLPVFEGVTHEGAHSGRGLEMVQVLAERWGVEPHVGHGKTVWCEIAI